MGVCISKKSESSESKPTPAPAPDAIVQPVAPSTDIITNTNTNTNTNINTNTNTNTNTANTDTDIIDKPDNKQDQNINTTTPATATPITTTNTTTNTTNTTITPAIPAATTTTTTTATPTTTVTPTATVTTDTTATAPMSTVIPAATATPTATATTATTAAAAASTAGSMTSTTSGTAISTSTTTTSARKVSSSSSTTRASIDVRVQQEPAVRKELRELDDEELYRLLSSLQSIQESNDGRMWMKMAGIHGGGIPEDTDVKLNFRNIYWCPHRKVTFPAWHRAYLAEFEYMLQLYDNKPNIDQLGRHTSKHRLMLPYWDWAAGEKFPVNVPNILTADQVTVNIIDPYTQEKKSVTFQPNPLASAPARPGGAGTKPRRTRRRAAEQIAVELFNRTVGSQVAESLAEPNFTAFAASSNGPYSIETPHDGVHISCGGDMWAVNTAAFDPIFWFHHNNVDRLWYAWELYHVTDANRVYLSEDVLNEELQPFSPWSLSSSSSSFSPTHILPWQNDTGKYTHVRDWSDHKTMPVRYSYSYYPPAPIPRGIQMRSRRMLVVIRDVPTPPKSVDVYVYLKKRNRKHGTAVSPSSSLTPAAAASSPSSSSPPSSPTNGTPIDVSDHVNIAAENDGDCAGIISIFSFDMTGQDSPDEVKCVACMERGPLTYTLDVTDFAAYLDVRNPFQGIISTVAFFVDGEGEGAVWPEPTIVNNAQLVWEDDWSNDHHRIREKQARYLNYYGYLPRRVTYDQARHDYLNRWQSHDLEHLMRMPRSGNADGAADSDIRILIETLRHEIINAVQSIPTTTLSSATTSNPITIDINLQWCVTNVDTELLPYFKPDPQHPQQLPILVQHLATHSFASWSEAVRQYTHTTPVILHSANNAAVSLNLVWQYVTAPSAADIEITWRAMDCPGRTVGYANIEQSRCVIALDTAEEWVLSMQPSSAASMLTEDITTIALDQVIRHELGHCFGLHHDEPHSPTTVSTSSSGGEIDIRDSIMYPFIDGRIRHPAPHDASLIISALRLA